MERYDIDSDVRVTCFLAQTAHESAGFRRVLENLNYSAAGLRKTFAKYFTPAQAELYAHRPEQIANRVYANRMGNGNESSGDGWLYRGRGLLQITGRTNYAACGAALGIDLLTYPDSLTARTHAAMSAAWYWSAHGCNELADAGDFERITKAINGGMNGYDDRVAWLDRTREAFA